MGEDTKQAWMDWFKEAKGSNYIPDCFGIQRKRADEIRDAIGEGMTRIMKDDNLAGNAETLFMQAMSIANISTPSEFGLMAFYLGQFHIMAENKSDDADKVKALTSVLVEMGKLLSRLSTPAGDLEAIKQMVKKVWKSMLILLKKRRLKKTLTRPFMTYSHQSHR